jgi:hypothetical protein
LFYINPAVFCKLILDCMWTAPACDGRGRVI